LLFSNFVFLPLAKRCSEVNKTEASLLSIILEGIMDICEQKNSHAISYRLESYLGLGESANRADLQTSSQRRGHVLPIPLKEAPMGK
jgi:flagellar motor component MotA